MSCTPKATKSHSRTLNIGVVGIGRMGQQHALNLLWKTRRANLVCACSPAQSDLDWAEEHLVPYGVSVCSTFEELLAFPGLEAVIIASATPFHQSQTLECIRRGIHVLCEKPVTNSSEELQKVIGEAEAVATVKVMVGFTRRFDDNYREAFSRIKEGAIGDPIVIRSQACDKLDMSPFYKSYLQSSGGIFLDGAIHDIDLALFFFGDDVQPKSVWAAGIASHHKELEQNGDADNAVGICQFYGGKIAYFYNSRTTALGFDNQTEIFGMSGKISINLSSRRNKLEQHDSSGIRIEPNLGWAERYSEAFAHEINSFTEAILENKPMPISLKSALSSLRIAEALQCSCGLVRWWNLTSEVLNDDRGPVSLKRFVILEIQNALNVVMIQELLSTLKAKSSSSLGKRDDPGEP